MTFSGATLRPAAVRFVLLAGAVGVPGALAQDPPGLGFAFAPAPDGLLVQIVADDGPAVSTGRRESDVVTGERDGGLLASWRRGGGASGLLAAARADLDRQRGGCDLARWTRGLTGA